MPKMLAVLTLIGVAGGAAPFADSNSAQLTVGVTVVRSCAVDSSPSGPAAPPLRLTCTTGAQSNLRVSESIRISSDAVVSHGLHVVTLNF